MAAARMTTEVGSGPAGIARAAEILRAGGIAAIPTETVYGLAGSAFSEEAAARIFEAKGRPSDNPLIVHVADSTMLERVVQRVPESARRLMQAFWPGPMSLILDRSAAVPAAVSGGLGTVAVRMPSHPDALAVIRAARIPLAAPSANLSGHPSPTEARHVLGDLGGRIPFILDGGRCVVGVESTVVDATGAVPVVLRPGAVTAEMIERAAGSVRVHSGEASPDSVPPSPGMKYVHYAPEAAVYLFAGERGFVAKKVCTRYDTLKNKGGRALILCSDKNASLYGGRDVRTLGTGSASAEHAIFFELRRADQEKYDALLFHYEPSMGEAVKNRIQRAAGGVILTGHEN